MAFFYLPHLTTVLPKLTDVQGRGGQTAQTFGVPITNIKSLYYATSGARAKGPRDDFTQAGVLYFAPDMFGKVHEGDKVTAIYARGILLESGPFIIAKVSKITDHFGYAHHITISLKGTSN